MTAKAQLSNAKSCSLHSPPNILFLHGTTACSCRRLQRNPATSKFLAGVSHKLRVQTIMRSAAEHIILPALAHKSPNKLHYHIHLTCRRLLQNSLLQVPIWQVPRLPNAVLLAPDTYRLQFRVALFRLHYKEAGSPKGLTSTQNAPSHTPAPRTQKGDAGNTCTDKPLQTKAQLSGA